MKLSARKRFWKRIQKIVCQLMIVGLSAVLLRTIYNLYMLCRLGMKFVFYYKKGLYVGLFSVEQLELINQPVFLYSADAAILFIPIIFIYLIVLFILIDLVSGANCYLRTHCKEIKSEKRRRADKKWLGKFRTEQVHDNAPDIVSDLNTHPRDFSRE